MAYYSSPYSGSDFGEYNYNSYAANNNYACNHDYGYDQSSYYYYPSHPTIAFSASTFSEPKLIEYDPNSGNSQLVIYYNTLEFNEPEFDEYDPTPYGGGYDLAQTYGQPLPPSDKTCYPRSGSDSVAPLALPTVEEGSAEKSAPIILPQIESAGKVTDKMPQPDLPEKTQGTHDLNPSEDEDIEEHGGDSGDDDDGGDYYSGSARELGNGYDNGEKYEEYEKLVPPQYPSGYGLEAMDLCESLFGYWPCLARMKKNREKCCQEEDDIRGRCSYRDNMWKGTADYLFGSPYPYDGGREEEGSSYGGGDFVYAYQKQSPMQSQYMQVEYNGNSW